MQWPALIRWRLMLLIAVNIFIFHTAISQSLVGAEVLSCDENGCMRNKQGIQVFLNDDAIALLPEWGKSQNPVIEIPPHDHEKRGCCDVSSMTWKKCHTVIFSQAQYDSFRQFLVKNKSAKGK